MAERARVPAEGRERHAALVRLVAVVEQEAGHGAQAPVRGRPQLIGAPP